MQSGIKAVIACAAAAALGCATSAQKPEVKEEQQRVTNVGYFDLRNCWPEVVEIPSPVSREALVGFLVGSRPELTECFVDPANRGPGQVTRAQITARVTSEGAAYEVKGENLTPGGIACAQEVLKARGGIQPLAQGASPVEAQIDFSHEVGVSPSVVKGVNEASDVAGAVRLAIPGWCDCFEPWKAKAPHSLAGSVQITRGPPAKVDATLEPSPDPEVQGVQACVAQKLSALKVPEVTSQSLKVPVFVLLVHSGVNDVLPGEERPELQFIQLEALRAQRAADVAMSLGHRAATGKAWDQLVAEYKAQAEAAKKTKKSPTITVKELKDRCADLLAADDAWIAALERQQENEQRTLDFAQTQAAKDPRWSEVASAAKGQVEAAGQDLANAKKTRGEDAAACPKERY